MDGPLSRVAPAASDSAHFTSRTDQRPDPESSCEVPVVCTTSISAEVGESSEETVPEREDDRGGVAIGDDDLEEVMASFERMMRHLPGRQR